MSTTGRRDSVTADDGTGKYIMSRRGKANDYSEKRRCKYSVLPTTMDDNFCVNFCCLALMIKLSLSVLTVMSVPSPRQLRFH